MSSSEYYRREILKELAQGNIESWKDTYQNSEREYENFDDFAQRTSLEQGLSSKSLNQDRLHNNEQGLPHAIASIQPKERYDVARKLFNELKCIGLNSRDLERLLSLSNHNPNRTTTDDVSKLAAFVYRNHPDIFQQVLTEQPATIKFLTNPIVGAALGAIAARWFCDQN